VEGSCETYPLHDILFLYEQNHHDQKSLNIIPKTSCNPKLKPDQIASSSVRCIEEIDYNVNLNVEVIASDFLHEQDRNNILTKVIDMNLKHKHLISLDHKDKFCIDDVDHKQVIQDLSINKQHYIGRGNNDFMVKDIVSEVRKKLEEQASRNFCATK